MSVNCRTTIMATFRSSRQFRFYLKKIISASQRFNYSECLTKQDFKSRTLKLCAVVITPGLLHLARFKRLYGCASTVAVACYALGNIVYCASETELSKYLLYIILIYYYFILIRNRLKALMGPAMMKQKNVAIEHVHLYLFRPKFSLR